ncbi:hypothetical protein CXB51_007900 [Gossypium anomalum]|uniref:Nodulin-like domain-containing protein n=1 Tax=Gossypium anomalum TaxID=47600 RepID=A0A8J5YUR7_9ROSI|nr:hypothetical protein CXB51_007900 [Gossypium anomalum]
MESLLNTKWVSTAASIWIQCTSGASYTFGIYSSVLKSSQSYDQSTLDTVFRLQRLGANVGVLSGLLYSTVTTSSRRSGVNSRTLGGSCGWGHTVLCWVFPHVVSVVGLISRPPVPLMCLFMLVAAHAQTFFIRPMCQSFKGRKRPWERYHHHQIPGELDQTTAGSSSGVDLFRDDEDDEKT